MDGTYSDKKVEALRKLAGDKAKTMGKPTTEIRQRWNRKQCIDFLVTNSTDKVIEKTLPVAQNTANAVNPPLPALKRNKNHSGMLPNGRSAKGTPDFSKWFGRVHPSDVSYPSWKYLSKTSTDVANICKAKHDHAAHCGKKDASGFPWFEFSFKEAVRDFKISRPTFDKSIKQLVAVGFLKYRMIGDIPQCGNFVDGKGTPAQYQLSNDWRTWSPDMDKILNPAVRKKGPVKKQNPSKPVFTSTGKPSFTSKAA